MELFLKIVNNWMPLHIFVKSFILYVWYGSEYISVRWFFLKLTKSVFFYRFPVCDFLLTPYSLRIIRKLDTLSFQCLNLVRVSLVVLLVVLHKVLYLLLWKLLLCYIQKLYNLQVKTRRLISQLIKCLSRVLQKLLKLFNCTAIFGFILPSLSVLSKNFDLNLNYLESVIILFGSSLQNRYKFPNVSE